jgi:hypothetical protein
VDTETNSEEWTIDKEYYVDFFERLHQLQKGILVIPEKLHKDFSNQSFIHSNKPSRNEIHPQYHPEALFSYLAYHVVLCIKNMKVLLRPKFNVNRFLLLFDLIKPDEGYTLDYQYCHDHPRVYSRQDSWIQRYFNYDKTCDTNESFQTNHIENISFEQSPKGFFQFALFSHVIHQFYLYQHETCDDTVFIYSKNQIEDILKGILREELEDVIQDQASDLYYDNISEKANAEMEMLFINRAPEEDFGIFLGPLREIEVFNIETHENHTLKKHWTTKEELRSLIDANLDPRVTMLESGYGAVKMLSFTKHGGFKYCTSYIRYPNIIEKKDLETVLEYRCHEIE